jgi:maltooligosyltrehalose trehalohydrolase
MTNRRVPVGAELLPGGGVHFRLWSPHAECVTLVIDRDKASQTGAKSGAQMQIDMHAEGNGYWSCGVKEATAGLLYGFKLDTDEKIYPDPASRYQPAGPHALSQVIDPAVYSWTDAAWPGIAEKNRVIYEMHIGTFTPAGTYRAAAEQLEELAALGITVIELMPVAEFDGAFGWGYDGVAIFAPYHHYGTPDDLRHFVDHAHAVGIGVILDVVYNHCGASGCYLERFSKDYFTDRYECEWGDALNFDGEHSGPVREYFLANACYWIREFHMDGLRLDATQQIFDASSEHIVAAIVREVRSAAGHRNLYIVGENEPQHAQLVRAPQQGGYGLDALWNDDFHHAATVALKGHGEAYFTDYFGTPQEFISSVKYGYLYQGQWYRWQHKRRGTPGLDLPPDAFVHFIQNHDQIANSGIGKRIHQVTGPGLYRAMTALLLLGPATPMLFQGQEFGASAPFLYFADHNAELAPLVQKGRTEFLHQFPSLAAPEMQKYLCPPHDPDTFARCKLDFCERRSHREIFNLHRDLLALRRNDPVFSQPYRLGVDGAVLSDHAFVLRFFSREDGSDRLLFVNMGKDLLLSPAPEPLLAPVAGCDWVVHWSSEHPRYGGCGTGLIETTDAWRMPGMAAVVFMPRRQEDGKEVHDR